MAYGGIQFSVFFLNEMIPFRFCVFVFCFFVERNDTRAGPEVSLNLRNAVLSLRRGIGADRDSS